MQSETPPVSIFFVCGVEPSNVEWSMYHHCILLCYADLSEDGLRGLHETHEDLHQPEDEQADRDGHGEGEEGAQVGEGARHTHHNCGILSSIDTMETLSTR